MSFIEGINTLEYFIRAAGDLLCFLVIFRGQLRVSPWVVVGGFAFYAVGVWAWLSVLSQPSNWMINVPTFLMEMGMCYLFVRERRVMNFTVYCTFIILFDCIGSLMQGGLYGLLTAIEGSAEWLVKDQADPLFRLGTAGLLIPAYALSCLIALKVKPMIMEARGWIQPALVVVIPVSFIAGNVIKCILLDIEEYTNNPGGFGLAVDGVRVVLFFAVMVCLLAKAIRGPGAIAETDGPVTDEGEDDRRAAVEEARRRGHDAANWAAAGLLDSTDPMETKAEQSGVDETDHGPNDGAEPPERNDR